MAANLRRALLNLNRTLNSTVIPNRSSSSPSHIPKINLLSSQYGCIMRFSATRTIDIDLSNEESKRRLVNSILYRSKQRGYLELDLVLGKWVEDHIHSMDENGIKYLLHVLDLENPDLWKWLTGQEQPPETVNSNPVFAAVRNKVMINLENHASPETRAMPGKPWVRGWDDYKKGRDSPITGNQ
uniref:Ankyrin repeat family protein n=1 Tax=Melianthus villosus TaxID=377280 RepID=A0A0G4AMI6_9ROSI|nr:ankyrin repeat family protein [Melianthus villosus]